MARWVLPVLVGPSTAVTPLPGARPLADVKADEEKAIFIEFLRRRVEQVFHNATHQGSRLKLWNESGTNRARIGDSYALRLRSPQHLAWNAENSTRSSLTARNKPRFDRPNVKRGRSAESNQKRARVNRDSSKTRHARA